MNFESEFTPIPLESLHHEAAVMKVEGWRFIQTHAVNTDAGVDLYYSFMKDGHIKNLKIEGVTKDMQVPSVTDLFLAAFVFENEARELFGVDMRDIAIDFSGAMYAPAIQEPMTFLSPEQKAARDKARKAQAEKAAKGDAPAKEATDSAASAGRVFVMTPERRERLDKKLATMSPEKVAKVEAALKAREAEAASAATAGVGAAEKTVEAQPAASESSKEKADVPAPVVEMSSVDHELEAKIALLDAEKAQKVRDALQARSGGAAVCDNASTPAPVLDADLESKISQMDNEKAQKVRAALAAKAVRDAQRKGGE